MTLQALSGARIRGVHVPEPDLLVLELALLPDHERAYFLVDTSKRPAIGITDERPRGRAAEGVAKLLRNELEGGVLRNTLAAAAAIAFDVQRGDGARGLVLELGKRDANVILLDAEGLVRAATDARALRARGLAIGEAWSPPEGSLVELPETLEALRLAGPRLLAARAGRELAQRRLALRRALTRERERTQRRADATAADAARADTAPDLRARAGALLSSLASIPERAILATLDDFTTDPPTKLSIEIDPKLGPRGTADALFRRARKLEAGAAIARGRHAEASQTASALAALIAELDTAPDGDALDALAERAHSLGIRTVDTNTAPRAAKKKKPTSPERLPYRRYVGTGDREIRVGRGAADNDALTLRASRAHDLWLHAKDGAGAHVVVPLRKGETCPPELLLDAATLAAHHSQLRGEDRVEILHAPRGRVRKPKGAKPGQVILDRAKTLLLRVEPDRVARLEATKQKTE